MNRIATPELITIPARRQLALTIDTAAREQKPSA